MSRRRTRATALVASLGSLALIGSAVSLAAPVGAASGQPPLPPSVKTALPPPPGVPQVARGIIVRTIGSVGVAGARAAIDRMPNDVTVARTRSLSAGTDLLLFDGLVPADEAQRAAATAMARPDVLWAEPDLRVQPSAAPVIPNDPDFGRMKALWNGGGNSDYSIKAPLIWGTETGAPEVVVAIIDTGITRHPDLDANVTPGYDFVSDVRTANDGNGRDPDPADPGDWITEDEDASGYFAGCEVSSSSWHGTHVSGTVAAVQGNSLGVTGVAPNVKVQAVRALGKCGGYTSDIADAITWASGGAVSGAPANPTPAKVINLSLGGNGTCAPESLYGRAVTGAIARGATVVVAAGNEAEPITQKVPANCAGVITVTAVDINGQRAAYSNYGVQPGQATLAAPGGDYSVDSGILSTINAGATSPVYPARASEYAYEFLQGTSMATPHVAGAAALVYSSGVTDPAAVRAALVTAVQPFGTRGNEWDCTVLACGAGILDASRLDLGPSVTTPSAPTGLMAVADGTTTAHLEWSVPGDDGGSAITGYAVRASRDGAAYADAGTTESAATSIDIIDLVPGATYAFEVAAINSSGTGAYSAASAPLTMPTDGATPPGAVSGFTRGAFAKTGRTYRVMVRWQAPVDDGGSPVTGYVARVGAGSRWSPWSDLARPSTVVSALRPGTRYTLQVRAVNAEGEGDLARYSFATPRTTIRGGASMPRLVGATR